MTNHLKEILSYRFGILLSFISLTNVGFNSVQFILVTGGRLQFSYKRPSPKKFTLQKTNIKVKNCLFDKPGTKV